MQPKHPIVYASPSTPQYYVFEDTDGVFWFVAPHNGWAKRHPYRGPRQALRPVEGPNTINAIRDLAGVPNG